MYTREALALLVIFMVELSSRSYVANAEEICVEGFIMDDLCIKRKVLLNKENLKTLDNPEEHAMYCLVDLPQCYNSGFHVLVPNPLGETKYKSAFQFDKASESEVLKFARSVGSGCNTCSGKGTVSKGLRATVIGEVIKQGQPPLLKLKDIKVSPRIVNAMSNDGCPAKTTSTIATTTTPTVVTTTTKVAITTPDVVTATKIMTKLPSDTNITTTISINHTTTQPGHTTSKTTQQTTTDQSNNNSTNTTTQMSTTSTKLATTSTDQKPETTSESKTTATTKDTNTTTSWTSTTKKTSKDKSTTLATSTTPVTTATSSTKKSMNGKKGLGSSDAVIKHSAFVLVISFLVILVIIE